MSDKRTCLVCGRTFDGYGLRLWCSVGCETNSFEIASLESRLQAMTERAANYDWVKEQWREAGEQRDRYRAALEHIRRVVGTEPMECEGHSAEWYEMRRTVATAIGEEKP